jgi:hypothetical protein
MVDSVARKSLTMLCCCVESRFRTLGNQSKASVSANQVKSSALTLSSGTSSMGMRNLDAAETKEEKEKEREGKKKKKKS